MARVQLTANRPDQETPKFSSGYTVEGVILLPYAELKEPFTAYYDAENGRSRIDYYGDLEVTVQRGDIEDGEDVSGINYKIAWMVDSRGAPERVCFQVNGSADNPVHPQNVIPDISDFKLVGHDTCPDWNGDMGGDLLCEKYEKTMKYLEKESKYVFWLKRGPNDLPIPVHYLMKGYNSLLGSHYDEYKVSYKNYKLSSKFSDATFEVESNMSCRSFPGPGHDHVHLHNPIKEFVDGHDKHIDLEFEKFKTVHGKKYKRPLHEEEKKIAFRHNFRFIQSMNRKNVHFKVGINHLTDFTDQELKQLKGRLHSPNLEYNGGRPFHTTLVPDQVPNQHDWRLYGAVNPVKDQAVCGSCWSFGTTGTIEGAYFVKTGRLVRLSEQQLIDCSWQQGDNGCDGGEDFRAYDYVMRAGGISLNEDYGGYLGADGKCHDSNVTKAVKLSGFVNVTDHNVKALEAAIFEHGPVTVAINANPRAFTFYSNGVFNDQSCTGSVDDLDHQVLAVGFGSIRGERYWLIKNSWSTYWGNDGYILISQENNTCGVTTVPTYPVIKE